MPFDARTDQKKIADLQSDVAGLVKLVAEQQEQIGSLQQGYLEVVSVLKKMATGPRWTPDKSAVLLPPGVSMKGNSKA